MVGMLDYLMFRQQQAQDAQSRQAMMDVMRYGAPSDQVNITPRVQQQQLMMPSPQGPMPNGAASAPMAAQGGLMPGASVNPLNPSNLSPTNQIAQRVASGAYQGPAPPGDPMAMLSAMPPAVAMQLMQAMTASRIAPKAPVSVADGSTLVGEGPDGKYAPVYSAPPKKPTFAEAPHTGINPATGKQDQFIIGNDGSQKWLSTPPGPKINFVNGQAVDENAVTPGTVIPQQAPQPTPPKSDTAFNQEKTLAQIRADNAVALKQTAPASAGAALTDAQATLFAEQILAGDKTPYATVGRNTAARTQMAQRVADLAAERGIKGADLAAANAAFAGDTQAQRTIGQRTGAIAVSGQEAKGVAGLVKDAYAKLPRGQFKPFNELRSMWDNQTNSPEQGAAYMADFSLQTAYARALNPQGVPRESDIEVAGKMLNGAGDSYEKHMAVVDQILKEIEVISGSTGAARLEAINRIRSQRGLPAEPGSGIAQPATGSNIDDLLKKYGPK